MAGVLGSGLGPFYAVLAGTAGLVMVGYLVNLRRHKVEKDTGVMRLLVFAGLAFLAAGIPAMTLGVSLTDVGGERFIYWSSVFAALTSALFLAYLLPNQKVLATVGTVLLLATTLSLQQSNQVWATASALAESTTLSLQAIEPASSPETRNLLVNVPDNYQGAIIFRNGLWAANIFFGQPDSGSLITVATMSITEPPAQVVALPQGADTYRLESSVDNLVAVRGIATLDFTVVELRPDGYTFQVTPNGANYRILFYRDGVMEEISQP